MKRGFAVPWEFVQCFSWIQLHGLGTEEVSEFKYRPKPEMSHHFQKFYRTSAGRKHWGNGGLESYKNPTSRWKCCAVKFCMVFIRQMYKGAVSTHHSFGRQGRSFHQFSYEAKQPGGASATVGTIVWDLKWVQELGAQVTLLCAFIPTVGESKDIFARLERDWIVVQGRKERYLCP